MIAAGNDVDCVYDWVRSDQLISGLVIVRGILSSYQMMTAGVSPAAAAAAAGTDTD